MELKYTVHLDDYHSNITAFGVRSVRFAVAQVRGEIDNGYDVTNITLDGQPVDLTPFCPRVLLDGEPCPNRVALQSPSCPQDGHLGTCITHDHQDRYDRASAEGRYQGD